jgi:hypothetical protein
MNILNPEISGVVRRNKSNFMANVPHSPPPNRTACNLVNNESNSRGNFDILTAERHGDEAESNRQPQS